MSAPVTALATIRYQWVRVAGLEKLLMPLAENRNPSLTGTLVLAATSCNTSDPGFVEIAFSNPLLELEGSLYVPKAEVVAIVRTHNPNDMYKVGFKGRSSVSLEHKDDAETPHPVTTNDANGAGEAVAPSAIETSTSTTATMVCSSAASDRIVA